MNLKVTQSNLDCFPAGKAISLLSNDVDLRVYDAEAFQLRVTLEHWTIRFHMDDARTSVTIRGFVITKETQPLFRRVHILAE